MLAAIFHHHLVLNPSKSVSLWQHTCATSYQGLWQSNSLSANVALLQSRSALLPAFYSNPETIRNIYSKYKHGWQGRKAAFCCGQFFFFFTKTWWESSFFPKYQGSVKRHGGYDWSYWKSSRTWLIKPLLWPLAREKQLPFKLTRLCFMSSIIVADESSISTASIPQNDTIAEGLLFWALQKNNRKKTEQDFQGVTKVWIWFLKPFHSIVHAGELYF